MSKRNRVIENLNTPVYICICTLCSFVLLALFSFITALICNSTSDPSMLTDTMSFISLLLTAAIGSYIYSRLRGVGGGVCAMLSAALFVTLRIIVSIFISGSDLGDLLDCLCYLGMGAIFALLGQKGVKSRRRR